MINFKVTSIKTMQSSPETDAMVRQHMATKIAEQNRAGDLNGVNEEMIAKYRAEYQDFLKNLEHIDLGTMFSQPSVEKIEEPLPETVHEEAYQAFVKNDTVPDMVNGISVGEEAGDSFMIAKKAYRKKKAAESAENA